MVQLPEVTKQGQRVWIIEFASTYTAAVAPFAQLPALTKHDPIDVSDGLEHTTQLNPETRYIRIISGHDGGGYDPGAEEPWEQETSCNYDYGRLLRRTHLPHTRL